MIYCPSCGTANRSGSKFCNQCGHNLTGGSKAACPACGAANPTENLFCDSCGAKLAPLMTKGSEERTEIKGLSLPTKPIDEEGPVPADGGETPMPLEEEASPPEEDPEAEEEMPEWLLQLRAASSAPGGRPEEPEPQDPLLPEDLGEVSSEEFADEEGLPEWLRQMEPDESIPPEEELPVPEVEQQEGALPPDLWAEEAEREAPESEWAEPEAPPPVEAETPALKLPDELMEEADEMPGEIPALAESLEDEDDLAAWLQEEGPVILEPSEGEEEEGIVFEPDEGEGKETPDKAKLPSWIETLAPEGALPEELGGEFAEEGKLTPEEMGLERAEIPPWLAGLRPGRPGEETLEAAETVEESGVLQGVVGALRLVQDIDPLPSAQTRPMSDPVAATPAQADLFSNLLAKPVASLARPRTVSTAPKRERGLPWLATLLLIAAVLLPFFATGFVPGGDAVPASQPVADLAENIQALQETDTVLVSFDYDPGVSTELDWPARVILDDLGRKGVKFLVMGVTPTGPGLATRFDIPSERTLYLGYLPGQEMGLQRLASNLEGTFRVDFFGNAVSDTPYGIESLNDVALVLTIAASQETVRWWMEQVGTQTDTPVGAIVSGAIEPAVRPYYASGQLVGLVSGWVGAQAYEQIANPSAAGGGSGQVALEAQSMAHLAIAGLIVLGNIVYWGKRLFGRQA